MRPIDVAGATHRFDPPANWNEAVHGTCFAITARVEVSPNRNEKGEGLVTTTVAWLPTPEEARKLAAGAVLELTFCSNGLPAHRMDVVEALPVAHVPHGTPAVTINEDAHGMGYDEFGPAIP